MTRLPLRTPLRLAATLAVACLTLASCSAHTGIAAGGTGEASCAARIEYAGHTYTGRGGLKRDPAATGRLVTGVVPGCDDTGGQDPASGREEAVQVAELRDVPLDTALLWNDSVYVRDGRALPALTRAWVRAPRCTSRGGLDLTGDWLGVSGPRKPRFDGDVRPPYVLDVHVTDGPATYVGATIRIHVDATTDPALGPRDVRTSLCRGGQVTARITCVDGRFRAVALAVPQG